MVIITDSEQILEDISNVSLGRNVSQESRELLNNLPQEDQMQLFCKQILQNRLFVGKYHERRLVEFIGTYRDVVIVHKSEVDLKRDLGNVRSRLNNSYHSTWIGITGPNTAGVQTGIVLWVKLHDLPFGHYWFQIKQVKFREREIYLRLKMIRPLAVSDSVTDLIQQPTKKTDSQQSIASSSSWASSTNASENNGTTEKDWTETMIKWRNTIVEDFGRNFTTYATLRNLKESVCFIIATFMAVVAGVVYGIRFAGDFSIKFMREVSLFLQASTPIILGLIDFFCKLVGGLYLLLAMMWRGSTSQEGRGPQQQFMPRSSNFPPCTTPYPYRPLPLPPPSIGLHQNTSRNK